LFNARSVVFNGGLLIDPKCTFLYELILFSYFQQQEAPDLESLSLEQRQIIKIQERLRNALTPQYSWLFSHVGRLENGVKFLVDLRTDVLVRLLSALCCKVSLKEKIV